MTAWIDTSGWTKESGYSFGVFEERHQMSELLPIEPIPPDTTVTFNIISGELPPGLRLTNTTILGTPYEVARSTEYSFCIRAIVNNSSIYDRTFKITITGEDYPVYLTPEGTLAIGPNNTLYILSQSFVNFQIEAYDNDTSAGQQLEFYISNGILPPGLTLSKSGLISGFISPALAIKLSDGLGGYDSSVFDGVVYDFSGSTTITDLSGNIFYNGSEWLIINTNTENLRIGMTLNKEGGSGSFGNNTRIQEILYNDVISLTFDTPPSSGTITYYAHRESSIPKRINRNYEFEVSVSDGLNITQRRFKIFVVGDDFFTSDNMYWTSDNLLFSSDSTSLKPPTWITSSYLGVYRSDNYQTFILDVYGNVSYYFLEPVNASKIGYTLQNTVNDNIFNSLSLTFNCDSVPQVGEWVSFTKEYTIGSWKSFTKFFVGDVVQYNNAIYVCKVTHVSAQNPLQSLNNTAIWKLKVNTWVPSYEYTINTFILYNSITYRCILNHISVSVLDLNDTTKWEQYPSIDCYKIDQIIVISENYYKATLAIPLIANIPNNIQFYIGSLSHLPRGMTLDTRSGIVYGYIPYQESITKTYSFTISGNNISKDGDRASSARNFMVDIIGVIDSSIKWITNADLGIIEANYISTLKIQAESSMSNVFYTLTGGTLPPGLSLSLSGDLIGKVIQYGTLENCQTRGLTTFDAIFENETTFDRKFSFTITASDINRTSSISRTFYLTVTTPNTKIYANVYIPLLLHPLQRTIWDNFLHNTTIFEPSSIFRHSTDPTFGLQTHPQMLIYSGIESVEAINYISIMNLNNKKKRFTFGDIKHAYAILPTNEIIYEVIYVEIMDPNKNIPLQLTNIGINSETITVDNSKSYWSRELPHLNDTAPNCPRPIKDLIPSSDSTGYFASNSNISTYYPNSVNNWRLRIKNSGLDSERKYLPLWMRSIQPNTKTELGFVLCIPLCFCNPGKGLHIMNNISNSGFTFNQFNFVGDRYIIEPTQEYNCEGQPRYLIFNDQRIII